MPALLALFCWSALAAATAEPGPRIVEIEGYAGAAMEPFVSADGRWLLFNDDKNPGTDKDLHAAERSGPDRFRYLGPLAGANSKGVDGVPSLDSAGGLYFVSTRSYDKDRVSLYRAPFKDGRAGTPEQVPGISLGKGGWINMDAEITADGSLLYYTQTQFKLFRPVPARSDILIARREGGGFVPLEDSARLFQNVNSEHLEFAPSVSKDGLELFFTRLSRRGRRLRFELLLSTRAGAALPFGPPRVLAASDDVLEGPCLSGDDRRLYYHQRIDGRFRILVRERPFF